MSITVVVYKAKTLDYENLLATNTVNAPGA